VWYELQAQPCDHDNVNVLSEWLEELGAVSITLTDQNDNPVLEPAPGTTPLWPDVILTALFSEEEQANIACEQLVKNHPHMHCSINIIPEKDWERVWMDDFKPQKFGNRLWICPSWLTPPDPNATNLILDPGLAFGTGTHPTTSLCLHWLDQADLQGKRVIDYGCGSGILALAALKLGATFLHAVDIDPQALQAVQNNAETNHIDACQLAMSFPDALHTSADVIIANILLEPLIQLQERFHALLNKHGKLVVSGILNDQAPILINQYQQHFIHEKTQQQGDWSLIVFTPIT
jgi:ribosomal protein L11 methyltransferase